MASVADLIGSEGDPVARVGSGNGGEGKIIGRETDSIRTIP